MSSQCFIATAYLALSYTQTQVSNCQYWPWILQTLINLWQTILCFVEPEWLMLCSILCATFPMHSLSQISPSRLFNGKKEISFLLLKESYKATFAPSLGAQVNNSEFLSSSMIGYLLAIKVKVLETDLLYLIDWQKKYNIDQIVVYNII